MIFTIRLCILIVILGFLFSRAAFSQEEDTRTFGYSDDSEEHPDAMEAVVFQPDPDADQAFLLYLESSMDLESWQLEGLQDYQVNDDGTIVATGEDAINRKFWRMRIMHPNNRPEEEWLAVLKVKRTETDVTAMMTVRTNYYPFVESYVQYALDMLHTLEWDTSLEDPGPVNTAVEEAFMRVLETAKKVRFREGDYFEATRPIQSSE